MSSLLDSEFDNFITNIPEDIAKKLEDSTPFSSYQLYKNKKYHTIFMKLFKGILDIYTGVLSHTVVYIKSLFK